jgi:hypothetical protein
MGRGQGVGSRAAVAKMDACPGCVWLMSLRRLGKIGYTLKPSKQRIPIYPALRRASLYTLFVLLYILLHTSKYWFNFPGCVSLMRALQ